MRKGSDSCLFPRKEAADPGRRAHPPGCRRFHFQPAGHLLGEVLLHLPIQANLALFRQVTGPLDAIGVELTLDDLRPSIGDALGDVGEMSTDLFHGLVFIYPSREAVKSDTP